LLSNSCFQLFSFCWQSAKNSRRQVLHILWRKPIRERLQN